MSQLDHSAPAYSDAPVPHPNLFIGGLHLLAWLFFRPSAWCKYVARIDPALKPDFALADLSRAHWRRPAVYRLVFQVFGIWLLLVHIFLYTALRCIGISSAEIAHVIGSTVVITVFVSISIPLAALSAGFVTGTLAVGAAFAAGSTGPFNIAGLGFGILGSVMLSLQGRAREPSATRQAGAIIISFLVGGIVSGIVPGLMALAGLLPSSIERSLLLGVGVGGAFAVTIGWGNRRRQGGIVIGLLLGGMIGLINAMSIDVVNGAPLGMDTVLLENLAYGIIYAVWLSIGFTVAYRLADYLSGPWAARLASVLGLSAAYLSTSAAIPSQRSWPPLLLSAGCIALGLTFHWWRPLVLYPFMAAWNVLLYRADARSAGGRDWRLRWHAAFWDEHQWLPLLGLDEHLVLVLERDPAEGQAAIERLADGRQRWAAQAAQIELDARHLERCSTAAAIGEAHRRLAVGALAGPASSLLRSFSRVSQDVTAALQQTSSYNQRLVLSTVEDHLDGLLRELLRSSERYALRFRPIAIHWREVVADHLRMLTEAAEQCEEIPSPYIIGVPLTSQQALFVGRADISARIERMILDQECPPLLLYGQRRMGKTSLLNNLGRLLPSAIVPLFVDMQGPVAQASDHAGFLAALARAMRVSAQRQRDIALPPLSRQELAVDPFPRFDEWLDEVEDVLAQHTALLVLDEFEALDDALNAGRFDESAVLGTFRHMIQHRARFKLLLAGAHTLDELRRWSSYLINVQLVHLSYLRAEEARQLVERPIKDFPLAYAPAASQRVLELTRSHPALVQLLCAEIIGIKNAQSPVVRRLARLEDVEAAVPEALCRGGFFFADIERNQVDTMGLELLPSIAALGEAAVVDRVALARQFPHDLDRALSLLEQRELIEQNHGGYRFQVELIRRWFA